MGPRAWAAHPRAGAAGPLDETFGAPPDRPRARHPGQLAPLPWGGSWPPGSSPARPRTTPPRARTASGHRAEGAQPQPRARDRAGRPDRPLPDARDGFAATIRVTGELYEDREKIWPGKPGRRTRTRGASRPSPSWCSPRPTGSRPPASRTTSSTSASGRPSTGSWRSRARCEVSEADADLLLERIRSRPARRWRDEPWRHAAPDRRRAARAQRRRAARGRHSARAARLDVPALVREEHGERLALHRRRSQRLRDLSFVEAAIFLVSAGVSLLFTRAEGASTTPGGDGTVILLVGAWAALLLF